MASFFFSNVLHATHPEEPEETDININPAVQIYFQMLLRNTRFFHIWLWKKEKESRPTTCVLKHIHLSLKSSLTRWFNPKKEKLFRLVLQ